MQYVANVAGGLIVLILGIIIRVFKTADLVAGYNTLPKTEKAKYNKDKICLYVGNLSIICSLVLFLGAILAYLLHLTIVMISVSWVLFIAIIFLGLIYMNTGNRFLN